MKLTDEELAQMPLFPLEPYPRDRWDEQDKKAWPWLERGYKQGWFDSLPITDKSPQRERDKVA